MYSKKSKIKFVEMTFFMTQIKKALNLFEIFVGLFNQPCFVQIKLRGMWEDVGWCAMRASQGKLNNFLFLIHILVPYKTSSYIFYRST
jgi:hypothetical protein